jgi:hypothetical protein
VNGELNKMTTASETNRIVADLLPRMVTGQDDIRKAVAELTADSARTNQAVDNLAATVGTLASSHGKLASDFYESKKAPYQLWMTALGLIFIIIGGATWYLTDNITKSEMVATARNETLNKNMEERLGELTRRLTDHMEGGHPHSVIQMIEALDEKVDSRFVLNDQRLDERQAQKERELDSLRHEMETEINRARDRLEQLERSLSGLN